MCPYGTRRPLRRQAASKPRTVRPIPPRSRPDAEGIPQVVSVGAAGAWPRSDPIAPSKRVRVCHPEDSKTGFLEISPQQLFIVDAPITTYASGVASSIRPYQQRRICSQDPAELLQARRDELVVHMLEHVVGYDEVEFRILEGERVQRCYVKLGARAHLSRELDGLRAEIDPTQPVERPSLGDPGNEAARAASCIEQARAAIFHPRFEQRGGYVAHADLPPVTLLDRVEAQVVVGRNVSHGLAALGIAGDAMWPVSPASSMRRA